MRVLHTWLQQYVPIPFLPEELAERLGMLGLEIEAIEKIGSEYDGFVVGKVLGVEPHPNANRLTVCKVDTGKEQLHIVCGAPNVAKGQKVVVGLVGATVPHNQHAPSGKPLVLSRIAIRGVESQGMICSAYEMGLGEDATGIMVLDQKAVVGMPLARHLGIEDIAYDLEVTPNRPDWLGHVGIAREIGVLVRAPLRLPKIRVREEKTPARTQIAVRVEDRVNCSRFAVRVIKNVRVASSPEWLQRWLRNVGLRPVNNIVDVTNYVMMETGQPLHAFDYALVHEHTLVIKQLEQQKDFTSLDGKVHNIPPGAVMVCDADREISIAGIMGGTNTQISDSTTDVVLEAAYWNPPSIRRTAKALGVSTDASYRFERGVDPDGILFAVNRAAQLVLEVAGGKLLKGIVDVRSKKLQRRHVPLRREKVNTLLGTSFSNTDICRVLKPLGIRASVTKRDVMEFDIPSFRVDVEREVDLIEEIARVYGYDRIEEKAALTLETSDIRPRLSSGERARDILIGFGYQEAITNPIMGIDRASIVGSTPLRILNSKGGAQDCLRNSLIPGILSAVAHNHRNGSPDLRFFEVGHVFLHDHSSRQKFVEGFLEEERLALAISGLASPRHWSVPPRPVDLYDLKGDIGGLMDQLGLDKCRFIYYSTSNPLVEDEIRIEINGTNAGHLGKVRAEVLRSLGIEDPVFVSELILSTFTEREHPTYKPFSRYQKVRRDVSFIVDETLPSEEIHKVLLSSTSGIVSGVEMFDLYQGMGLPQGKKSLAFSVEMSPKDRTLTDQEIDEELEVLVNAVKKQYSALLRTSRE